MNNDMDIESAVSLELSSLSGVVTELRGHSTVDVELDARSVVATEMQGESPLGEFDE